MTTTAAMLRQSRLLVIGLIVASTPATMAQSPALVKRSPFSAEQSVFDLVNSRLDSHKSYSPLPSRPSEPTQTADAIPEDEHDRDEIRKGMWVSVEPGKFFVASNTGIPPLPDVFEVLEIDSANYKVRFQDAPKKIAKTDVMATQVIRNGLTEMIRKDASTAKLFLSRGLIELGADALDEALADFNDAIRLDARNPYSYYYRAAAYAKAGLAQEALGDLFEAIRLDGKVSAFYFARAEAYRKTQGYRRAIDDYTQVLRFHPNSTDALMGRALTRLNNNVILDIDKDTRRAVDDCNQVLRLCKSDLQALNLRAFAYLRAEDYPKAISNYSLALNRAPLDEVALLGRATARYFHGANPASPEIQEAIGDFTTILQLPNTKLDTKLSAFMGRGAAHSYQGRWNASIQDFTDALLIDSRNQQALSLRARDLMSLRQYDRAIDDYSRLNEFNPNDTSVILARAHAHMEHQQFPEAIRDYTSALRLRPGSIPALLGRGRAYEQRSRRAQALSDFEAVLTIDPHDQTAADAVIRLSQP